MATEKTRKALVYSAWVLVPLSLVAVLVIQAFQDTPEPSKPSFLSDLIIVTARTMPGNRKIDEGVTFVRAQAADSHTLQFIYTLDNYDTHPEDVDFAEMKSSTTQAVCAKQMPREQSIISLGGTIIFIYGSKTVNEVARIEVNKQSCEGL